MVLTMPSTSLSSGQSLEDQNMRYYLDAGFFDCPVCMELFSLPIYQCVNGHSVCSSCSHKIYLRRCPLCCQPTGKIRSLMVAKIMESLQVPCKHTPHGCNEILQYSKRAERRHEEETCKHKPLSCPHPSCLHECPSFAFALAFHLAEAHGVQRMQRKPQSGYVKFRMSNTDQFMMVDFGDDGLMLVHHEQHDLGDVFFCTKSTGTFQKYTLEVRCTARSSVYFLKAPAGHIQSPIDRLLIHVTNIG